MPGTKFSDVTRRPRAAPAWRWRLDLVLPTELRSEIGLNSEVWSLYAEQVRIGLPGIETRESFFSGSYLKFPKDLTWENMEVQFYEDEDYSIALSIQTWMTFIINYVPPEGVSTFNHQWFGDYAVPASYKAAAVLEMYKESGEVGARYAVAGIWPSRPAGHEFISDASTRVLTPVTFSIDRTGLSNTSQLPQGNVTVGQPTLAPNQ